MQDNATTQLMARRCLGIYCNDWKTNAKRGILLVSICLLVFFAFVGTASGTIWYVDDSGGADFTKIQDAINAANESDTIYVYNGSYSEHIGINKQITLIGEDRRNTIIEGGGVGSESVYIVADNVSINSFTILGSCGVYVDSCNYTIINNTSGDVKLYDSNNCTVKNNTCHIFMDLCNNITIANNTIKGGSRGMTIYSCNNSKLIGNNVELSVYSGIQLHDSYSNLLIDNVVTSVSNGSGIQFGGSNNILINNTVSSNHYIGIEISYGSDNNTLINNTITSNDQKGIYLHETNNNTLFNNTISYNENGIHLEGYKHISRPGGVGNLLINNTITHNQKNGIMMCDADNNCLIDNDINSNVKEGVNLYECNNNTLENNVIKSNGGTGIHLTDVCCNNFIIDNILSSNAVHGIYLERSTKNNSINGNIISDNIHGIYLNDNSNNNIITDNSISNQTDYGIVLSSSKGIKVFHNNLINNSKSAFDDRFNKWDNGSIEGGNYWSNHNCTGNPSNGSQPYNIDGGSVDHYPFEDKNGWIRGENIIFDTGASANPYPSIFGTHNGTIKPNQTIKVSKLYTYPCIGTGGHTEYVRIWNSSDWNVTASWDGYKGDWHNISFSESFTLQPDVEYNYTIRTGSYPQIHHMDALSTTNGWINGTKFTDANGKIYYNWIPAIRLWA